MRCILLAMSRRQCLVVGWRPISTTDDDDVESAEPGDEFWDEDQTVLGSNLLVKSRFLWRQRDYQCKNKGFDEAVAWSLLRYADVTATTSTAKTSWRQMARFRYLSCPEGFMFFMIRRAAHVGNQGLVRTPATICMVSPGTMTDMAGTMLMAMANIYFIIVWLWLSRQKVSIW